MPRIPRQQHRAETMVGQWCQGHWCQLIFRPHPHIVICDSKRTPTSSVTPLSGGKPVPGNADDSRQFQEFLRLLSRLRSSGGVRLIENGRDLTPQGRPFLPFIRGQLIQRTRFAQLRQVRVVLAACQHFLGAITGGLRTAIQRLGPENQVAAGDSSAQPRAATVPS
jgi:hypothetical protein